MFLAIALSALVIAIYNLSRINSQQNNLETLEKKIAFMDFNGSDIPNGSRLVFQKGKWAVTYSQIDLGWAKFAPGTSSIISPESPIVIPFTALPPLLDIPCHISLDGIFHGGTDDVQLSISVHAEPSGDPVFQGPAHQLVTSPETQTVEVSVPANLMQQGEMYSLRASVSAPSTAAVAVERFIIQTS